MPVFLYGPDKRQRLAYIATSPPAVGWTAGLVLKKGKTPIVDRLKKRDFLWKIPIETQKVIRYYLNRFVLPKALGKIQFTFQFSACKKI